MDILQGIRYTIQAWDEVTAETIYNCWRHTKILPIEEIVEDRENNQETDLLLKELTDTFKALDFPDGMQVEEFLALPKEDIVYEVPEEDHIISELVDVFKKGSDESLDGDGDEEDDSVEIELVSVSSTSRSLENIRAFLLQQENATEYLRFVNILERFVKKIKIGSLKQTTLEQFF